LLPIRRARHALRYVESQIFKLI